MRIFIRKCFLFSIPVWLFVGLYFYLDPFKVIYHYDRFYDGVNDVVNLNRDYVSTTLYTQQRKQYDYDSFIFGNSRSLYYETDTWRKHIGDTASCFHFDGANESLFGICKKLEYIDKQGDTIKNALFVIDSYVLRQSENNKQHLYYTSPALTNELGISFHLSFFKAFCTLRFAYAYCDFAFSKELKPYMINSNLLLDSKSIYNPVDNGATEPHWEKAIANGSFYDSAKIAEIENGANSQPHGKTEIAVIEEPQIQLLNKCKEILEKHKTNYKVIISPLYEKIPLNHADLNILQQILGHENIFDFSGINKYTSDYHNYYEWSHYRPCVAEQIMEDIYP